MFMLLCRPNLVDFEWGNLTAQVADAALQVVERQFEGSFQDRS